jgi:hypothetical protein
VSNRSKAALYSITSSARASSVGGTSSESTFTRVFDTLLPAHDSSRVGKAPRCQFLMDASVSYGEF